jgi:hypothetical protein
MREGRGRGRGREKEKEKEKGGMFCLVQVWQLGRVPLVGVHDLGEYVALLVAVFYFFLQIDAAAAEVIQTRQ